MRFILQKCIPSYFKRFLNKYVDEFCSLGFAKKPNTTNFSVTIQPQTFFFSKALIKNLNTVQHREYITLLAHATIKIEKIK